MLVRLFITNKLFPRKQELFRLIYSIDGYKFFLAFEGYEKIKKIPGTDKNEVIGKVLEEVSNVQYAVFKLQTFCVIAS